MQKNTWIILIILNTFIITKASSFDNYADLQICKNINNDVTESQIFHAYVLHQFDIYSFIILGPIGVVFLLFTMSIYFIQPRARQMPGDIILMLSVCDLFLMIQWISTSIYYLVHQPSDYPLNQMPASFQLFCNIESIFGIIGGTGQFVYNCMFCLFIIFQIRVGIKGNKNSLVTSLFYHILSISIILLVIIIIYSTGKQGLSIYGICTVSSNQLTPLFGLGLIFLYLILSIGTIYYFQKQIPDQQNFRKYRNSFLVYYIKYIVFTVVIWGILILSNLIITINCELKQPIAWLFIFISVGNFFKILTPVGLSIIRYLNPSVRPTANKLLNKIFYCFQEKKVDKYNKLQQQQSSIQMNWFNKITTSLRYCQILTIIIGLNQYFLYQKSKSQQLNSNLNKFKQKNTRILKKSNMQEQYKGQIIQTEITIFCPSIFKQYLNMDFLSFQDLIQSFSLQQNQSILKQQYSGQGGASGEFFLFSHDSRFILKTLTQNQVNVYLENIQNFYNHYKFHHNCLITKFYGVFTFNWINSNQPKVSIMITRNINLVPSKYIKITYDLKGSTYNREVLKENKNKKQAKVLKDIDFLKKQKKIYVSKYYLNFYKQILTSDSLFFKQLNIIDYSLIVSKVIQQQANIIPQRLGNVPSIFQKQIYYRFGVIDYLQIWNKKKFFEKTTKQVLKADMNLDTSSQDPQKYSQRFINNLLNRIFSQIQ